MLGRPIVLGLAVPTLDGMTLCPADRPAKTVVAGIARDSGSVGPGEVATVEEGGPDWAVA